MHPPLRVALPIDKTALPDVIWGMMKNYVNKRINELRRKLQLETIYGDIREAHVFFEKYFSLNDDLRITSSKYIDKKRDEVNNYQINYDHGSSQKLGAKKTDHSDESRPEAPSFPNDQRPQTTLPRIIEKIHDQYKKEVIDTLESLKANFEHIDNKQETIHDFAVRAEKVINLSSEEAIHEFYKEMLEKLKTCKKSWSDCIAEINTTLTKFREEPALIEQYLKASKRT